MAYFDETRGEVVSMNELFMVDVEILVACAKAFGDQDDRKVADRVEAYLATYRKEEV